MSSRFSKKRVLSFILTLCIILGTSVVAFAENSAVSGYLTFAVERFTIGQGYFIEPKVVPFYEGDNYATVLAREVGEDNLEYSGTLNEGFYLTGIKNADSGDFLIPDYISNELNSKNITVLENDDADLYTGDYTGSYSGWMCFVNNAMASTGMDSIIPQNGDVFRLQFSLYWGLDLGDDMGGYMDPLCTMANKDGLTKLYADIKNSDYDAIKNITIDDAAVNEIFNTYGQNLTVEQWFNRMPSILSGIVEDGLATQANLDALESSISLVRSLKNEKSVLGLNMDDSISPTAEMSLFSANGEKVDLKEFTINEDGSKSYQVEVENGVYDYIVTDGENEIGKGTFDVTDNMNITLSKWVIASNDEWVASQSYDLLVESDNMKITPIVKDGEFICIGEKSSKWKFTILPSDEMKYLGYTETVYTRVISGDRIVLLCQNKLNTDTNKSALEKLNTAIEYIKGRITNPTVSSGGGEWTIISLIRNSDVDASKYFDIYYENLVNLLNESDGILSSKKYTEYSRVILALTAGGKSPEDVAGYNLLEKLSDYDKTISQGITGGVFGLLALNSVDTEKTELKQKYVDYILSKELENGGFAFFGKNVDLDITAMVLQALAPYRTDENAKKVIDRALDAVSTTYAGMKETSLSAESLAQLIIALTSLGINPESDVRFVRDGQSILSGLLNFALDDGSFAHTLSNPTPNLMATEQSLLALVSYNRFVNGRSSIFDMSSDDKEIQDPSVSDSTASSSSSAETNNPDTGDTNFPIAIFVIFALSAIALSSLALTKKK